MPNVEVSSGGAVQEDDDDACQWKDQAKWQAVAIFDFGDVLYGLASGISLGGSPADSACERCSCGVRKEFAAG